ncbi:MAG: mechanosensitive ion channel [Halobacteriovoraceae bacterium]|nr:mechanosensitive ion channel [Halobacteriovoraceae bacterium]MCB9095792.1 mechanosensitive ion channel [Halobacteriovoraceae bacterium]
MFKSSDTYLDKILKYLEIYTPKVVGALVTFLIGLWVIRIITNIFFRQLEKRNVDQTLRPFLRSLLKNSLLVILIISVAGILGIQTSSFVAVIGAAGLAIGLALQGSLANFAGGVLILIFRPVRVGDYIKAQGYEGNVSEILLFVTVLKTPDNRVIYIPNGPLAGGPIENVTRETTRRVDLTFGISYSDDIDSARRAIEETIKKVPNILSEPAPIIAVNQLADSSVNIAVKPWVKTENYWQVFWDMQEMIKKEFDKQKISIPFPQRDVHLYQK